MHCIDIAYVIHVMPIFFHILFCLQKQKWALLLEIAKTDDSLQLPAEMIAGKCWPKLGISSLLLVCCTSDIDMFAR